ncbi:hypothetical protein CERSUDRAFT_57681 [Gelatoporia subvermispora B]|uniref:YCII-related domain-containing protein n=1 Tax=Ceriporiopsis subvermispora (strain B) TaxID=914234 RepID=M2PBJ8_CERS8|nr:hypothetical protein CERSUDRAFT_57681 [Gelatoporia subvermispora B]
MASTSSPTLYKFVVYAPDKKDPETLQHRQSLLKAHLAANADLINSGVFKVGGVLLSDDSVGSPDAKQTMAGSLIILEAENIEAVRDFITKDPFYTSGKWDTEKLAIHPFHWVIGQQ